MFKVGDRVKLRNGLIDGNLYGYVRTPYRNYKSFNGETTIRFIDVDGGISIAENCYWYASEMLVLVEEEPIENPCGDEKEHDDHVMSLIESHQFAEELSNEKEEWEETSKEWIWNGETLRNIINNNSIRYDGIYNVLELVVARNCYDNELGWHDGYSVYTIKQNATQQDLENLARKLGSIRI